MRGMPSKGIFESKSGSRETGAIWQYIVDNLNNCGKFAAMARSLRVHFTTFMKKYLTGEELFENEQLIEELIERFEESERRTEADTQKRFSL